MGSQQYNGENLKSVYVARTVESKQKGFDSFLKALGRGMMSGAAIRNIGSTHLTFLESAAVKPTFYNYGYTGAEVVCFTLGLQRYLDKAGHTRHPLRVTPKDMKAPLRWMGSWTKGKLAFDVEPSDQLLDARGRIEDYVLGQFGKALDSENFDPHITIGTVQRKRIIGEARQDPNALLPQGIVVPHWTALNGLEVYLGRIHQQVSSSPDMPQSAAEHIAAELALESEL